MDEDLNVFLKSMQESQRKKKTHLQNLMEQMVRMNMRVDHIEKSSRDREEVQDEARGIHSHRRMTRNPAYDNDLEDGSDFEEVGQRRGRRVPRDSDSNLGSIKMRIPSFKGMNDPEAYLEWERKVDHVFNVHNYSEEKKV